MSERAPRAEDKIAALADISVTHEEFPEWWWETYDDEPSEDEKPIPCCICTCLIGDEVGFGEANYFGDGRPICDQCIEAPPLAGDPR